MQGISLSQQLKQQTKLSPEQIQVIRMLEVPAVELQQRINEELQTNPALEEGKDSDWEQDETLNGNDDDIYGGEDDLFDERNDGILSKEDYGNGYDDHYTDDDDNYDPGIAPANNNAYAEDDMQETPIVGSTSLMEHLKSQVYLTKMTKPQRHIAKWVLGNIDDDGYLRRTTEQLVDDLSFQEGLIVSDSEMENIVRQIKQFDPAGVAAFDLQECLLTQLKQHEQTPAVQTAITILTTCFADFSQHHHRQILQRLNLTEEQLRDAINEVIHLNQKPANAFNGNIYEGHKETIIPDFYVENRDGELFVSLNTGDIPDLHVSRTYKHMLNDISKRNGTKDKEDARVLRGFVDSAAWFINAIQQRNETLAHTMTAIVQFQKEFFLEGDETFLKPMILQDIADVTGYDVSTISRVSNSKYVQTEFGIYPLKHFFSEALTNTEGDEISSREVKKILQEVIAQEDKKNPLNDDRLVEILRKHGYPLARRTIAKYRELMNIPVARLRKRV